MKKKRAPQKAYSLAFSLGLVGIALLLGLLVWVGSDTYITSQLEQATDRNPPETISIGQIIAPILEQESTYTLTFEDELPDPIFKAEDASSATVVQEDQHQLALIIDDVGYDINALRRVLALPYTVTVSILPDAPHAKEAAQMAYQHGVQVMLHMPMQTTNPKYQNKMEHSYLHTKMGEDEFREVFEDALAKVPHAVGINNHMGSALTEDKQSMLWLMKLCKQHNLFFIDSRTSSSSLAAKIAKESGIAWNARDIFLDHSIEAGALQHAWLSALACIKKNDHCIMLAHPHQETLNFLEHHNQGFNHQAFVSIQSVLK